MAVPRSWRSPAPPWQSWLARCCCWRRCSASALSPTSFRTGPGRVQVGIGLVIVVDQVPKLLGFHIEKGGFFRDILAMVQHVPQTSAATLVLGVAMLRSSSGWSASRRVRRRPDCRRCGYCRVRSAWPAGPGVATVGSIPRGLPALVWPQLDLLAVLWPGGGHRADELHREHRRGACVRQTRRAAPGAEPGVAGARRRQPGRRLLRRHARRRRDHPDGSQSPGRRTQQMAELVTAAAAVATLLLLAPLIAWMPHAVLAAVVVAIPWSSSARPSFA